jgi:hypothetical protein
MNAWEACRVPLHRPTCHLPLPPLPVTIGMHRGVTNIEVHLTPNITATWKAEAKLAHPNCFGGREDAPTEVAA